jgi:hypothetical protein
LIVHSWCLLIVHSWLPFWFSLMFLYLLNTCTIKTTSYIYICLFIYLSMTHFLIHSTMMIIRQYYTQHPYYKVTIRGFCPDCNYRAVIWLINGSKIHCTLILFNRFYI